MVQESLSVLSDVTVRGEASVGEAPSASVVGETDVVVVLAGLTVRMATPDVAWGWVSLGLACLEAAAREQWAPEDGSVDGLGLEDTMSVWRAAALRSVAGLVEWAATTADAWALYAVPSVVRVARGGRSRRGQGLRRVWGR